MAATEAPPDVGRRLRELREERGLSLRMLAEASGLSVNAVSLVERGQSSPTVATLHRLAAGLGVRIIDLFGLTEARVVFVRADQRVRTRTGGAIVETLGKGLAGQRIEPLVIVLEPGAGSGGEPITHSGQEMVLGLDGRMDYSVDGRVYPVGEGDVLLFEASLPHSWCNVTWQPARALLILETSGSDGRVVITHLQPK